MRADALYTFRLPLKYGHKVYRLMLKRTRLITAGLSVPMTVPDFSNGLARRVHRLRKRRKYDYEWSPDRWFRAGGEEDKEMSVTSAHISRMAHILYHRRGLDYVRIFQNRKNYEDGLNPFVVHLNRRPEKDPDPFKDGFAIRQRHVLIRRKPKKYSMFRRGGYTGAIGLWLPAGTMIKRKLQ